MDFILEHAFKKDVKPLENIFGRDLDIDAVLFLIGVNELGMGKRKFTKDQKLALIHIAVCTLLADYGFYTFIGKDKDGWPHWERTSKLPNLTAAEQEKLMKEAVIHYMEKQQQ